MKKKEKKGGKLKAVIIAIVIITIIGAFGNGTQGSNETQESSEQSQKKTEAPSLEETLPGLTIKEAMEKIKESDKDVTWYFSPGTSAHKIGSDPTSFLGEDEANWVVAEVKSGNKIIIDTPERIELANQTKERRAALEEKLGRDYAWVAVQQFAESQYPYGCKIHYILNEIAAEPVDDSTWYLKSTIDITNAYGATAKGLAIEAYVTGTNNAPEVTSFTVY